MSSPHDSAAYPMHAALFDRNDRAFIRLHGRDPLRMIQGLVSNDVAGADENQAVYATLLTPKGRMIADLRVFRRGSDVLLELHRAALDGVLATLKKFLPPLFARFEDVTATRLAFTLVGPGAPRILSEALPGFPSLDAREHAFTALPWEEGEVLIVRTLHTGEPGGWDIIAPAAAADTVRGRLLDAGARPAPADALDVLRIEAGRPIWGAELTEDVIPLEAGLRECAISETKGCYTGQEVIVRILHRGHVNRHLRGLLLGDAAVPARGTVLLRPEDGKNVGAITSACVSPRLGQTIALGYVRRELEPGAVVRVADGGEARVVALPFT